MRQWDFALPLEPDAATPVYLQIARALAEAVRSGRLAPGSVLPSSRTLAATLGVHRNTVIAGYEELAAEGWITPEAGRGTFVSRALPELSPERFAPAAAHGAMTLRLPEAPAAYPRPVYPPGTLVLGAGTPDPRLIPVDTVARAYRRALRVLGPAALNYADPQGHERLREAISAMLATTRGLAVPPERLLVTRGSQMGLYLLARALIRPGDVVMVEHLGYAPAWEAFRAAGARLEPLPVDGEGLSVEVLETQLRNGPVRAVYVTPHHQYPTTVALSPGRRLRLLELAQAHCMAIIEDDYDNEFHFEGRPLTPLASADRAGVVAYVGTLSKILAPGLRLGFVAAPAALIERLSAMRLVVDRQGDQAMEYGVAELMAGGEIQRHARKMRRRLQDRRDALAEALANQFGAEVDFGLPSGGMGLWARFAHLPDTDAWVERGAALGVGFRPERVFRVDGHGGPHVRLGYASLDEGELQEAVRRMARASRPPQ